MNSAPKAAFGVAAVLTVNIPLCDIDNLNDMVCIAHDVSTAMFTQRCPKKGRLGKKERKSIMSVRPLRRKHSDVVLLEERQLNPAEVDVCKAYKLYNILEFGRPRTRVL